MTEDEAKTKWCHERNNIYLLMNISGFIAASISPTIESKSEVVEQVLEMQKVENNRCIGSKCMQWRWTPKFTTNSEGKIISESGYDTCTVGYCGLGGKE